MYIIIKLDEEEFKTLSYNGEVFGKYQISNYGTIISKRCPNGIQPYIDKDGYETVTLYRNDGTKKLCRVNRLVAYNFVEAVDDPDMVVNHLDNDKRDNYYLNLEWVTQYENVHHAINHGSFDKNRLKKTVSKTYSEDFIHELCSSIEKFKKTKKVLDYLKIDKDNRQKIISLIHDIRNKKSWTEISSQYKIFKDTGSTTRES